MNNQLSRRDFIIFSAGFLTLFPTITYARIIRELEGKVWVNDRPIDINAAIKIGDTITTGMKSRIVFVIEQDVYKLGANSILELSGNDGIVGAMRLVSGALWGAFSSGTDREIETPQATMGIRGTGFYIEADKKRTYFCTCYGKTDLITRNKSLSKQGIKATHHNAFEVVESDNSVSLEPAKMLNHTDEDFHQLESMVGRKPPKSFK